MSKTLVKIYTMLTWLDFDRLEPREDMKLAEGGHHQPPLHLNHLDSQTSLRILMSGGREASELDRRLQADLVVVISMSSLLLNNDAGSSAAWGR